ncbi:hypothetical protein J4Q44_G00317070 [Coregonus suidteri]|uniref:Uncharacterized protein n=1 Tax=Coregonus suidteri TaxID=861788 RepID=A0AAN8QA13_9TELE
MQVSAPRGNNPATGEAVVGNVQEEAHDPEHEEAGHPGQAASSGVPGPLQFEYCHLHSTEKEEKSSTGHATHGTTLRQLSVQKIASGATQEVVGLAELKSGSGRA